MGPIRLGETPQSRGPRSPSRLTYFFIDSEARSDSLGGVQLHEVVPWGRSLEEYRAMFALSEDDLRSLSGLLQLFDLVALK
jgi:hypothetical protein